MSFYPTQGPIKADIDFTSTNEQLRRIEIELDRLNDQVNEMLKIFNNIVERLCNLVTVVKHDF
jgi:hypothetical protein